MKIVKVSLKALLFGNLYKKGKRSGTGKSIKAKIW